MKISVSKWQFFGFLFTGLGGVLLHFAYDWSGQSPLLAPISGVNESTWEHMKLLFFPMLIFALIQSRYFKERHPDFWCIKLYGILLGLALIPIMFYTFNGALGPSPDWYNIAIYYQAAAAAFLLENHLFKYGPIPCPTPYLALGILALLAVAFGVLTWFPPHIPLFRDPLTGSYGLN